MIASHTDHSKMVLLIQVEFTYWDDFEPYGPEYYDTSNLEHIHFRGVIQSENFMWAETTEYDSAAYICKKSSDRNAFVC